MRLAVVLVFLCALQGCGQKGPLRMPAEQPQTSEERQPDMQGPDDSSSLKSP